MNTKNYTIGLDLGDRRSTYCLLDAAGKIEAEDAVASPPRSIRGGVRWTW